MNSIMERWVRTCRHEQRDRTLIWNQQHLLHALHEFKYFYNGHPIGISRTPDHCNHYPNRSPPQTRSRTTRSADATVSAASCLNTNMPHDLNGRGYRHLRGLGVA
jgi:hypothetical protein